MTQVSASARLKPLQGNYLHLQRLSTEDGPGIRTTVFLKGCLLNCEWCHNPESISTSPQTQWLEHLCINCQSCVAACPNECLTMTENGLVIDRENCQLCGTCVEECPTNARQILGSWISADELFDELIKDQAFFQSSGGGITFSGGEPALQPDFTAQMMARLQHAGIHTALDTCGMVSRESLLKILPFTDLVLYDLKEIDPDRHKDFTGQSNQVILENLLLIQEFIESSAPDTCLWIRTPLIPGATATQENLEGICEFLSQNLNQTVQRWELCAFNNLCRDKYHRLGMDWRYSETQLLSSSELAQFESWAKQAYVNPDKVIATGSTQVNVNG